MSDAEVERLVGRLRGIRDVTDEWERLGTWATEGRIDRLVAVAERLGSGGVSDPANAGAVRSIVRRIEEVLIRPPAPLAVGELRAVRASTGALGYPDLEIASRIVGTREDADVFAFLTEVEADPGFRELAACVLHERIMRRGGDTGAVPVLARLAEALSRTGHPLAVLPIQRLDLESEAPHYMVQYAGFGSSHVFPPAPEKIVRQALDRPPRRLTRTEEAEVEARIARVVRTWTHQSNGRTEIALFQLEPQADAVDVRALLADTGLASVAGVTGLRELSPHSMFAWLFSAASSGGAYTHGERAAYGRLRAWEGTAALSGAPPGASIIEIETKARACTWLDFSGTTPWFCNVAWDIGLVGLRPDGRSLAIFAATDED